MPLKFEKKTIRKTNLQKTSPKNTQISIKTSPKTSNTQASKKTRNFIKKQVQIHGKIARLATLTDSHVLTAQKAVIECYVIERFVWTIPQWSVCYAYWCHA